MQTWFASINLKTVLETGTWNGGRAIEIALAAFEKKMHYITLAMIYLKMPQQRQMLKKIM